jgi:hypothetical protein
VYITRNQGTGQYQLIYVEGVNLKEMYFWEALKERDTLEEKPFYSIIFVVVTTTWCFYPSLHEQMLLDFLCLFMPLLCSFVMLYFFDISL